MDQKDQTQQPTRARTLGGCLIEIKDSTFVKGSGAADA
jgi:hypothetical protein